MLVLFGHGFLRVRRRRRADAGWERAALFGAATLLGAGALVGLEGAAEERFSAHMLQHVVVGDLAPALALLALRGPLAFAVVPAAFFRLRLVRFLLRPLPAFAVWAALLAVWHVPGAYELAARWPAVHSLQHVSFVTGGLLVWTQLIDPARRRALSPWGSLGFALAVMAGAQLLVMTLVVSYRPLYPSYPDLADQQRGALVMMLEQALTLGVFAAFRLRALIGSAQVAREQGHPLVL